MEQILCSQLQLLLDLQLVEAGVWGESGVSRAATSDGVCIEEDIAKIKGFLCVQISLQISCLHCEPEASFGDDFPNVFWCLSKGGEGNAT